MKTEVEVTKKDLFWMNSHMFFTSVGAYKIPIYAWLTMTGLYFFNDGLNADATQIVFKLLIFSAWALLILAVFYILSALSVLSNSSDSYGVLGKHGFEIKEDGFIEETNVNHTFTKWAGIHSLIKTKNYLYIKTAPLLAHIIPKRSFSNSHEFEEFYNMIKTGYDGASGKSR